MGNITAGKLYKACIENKFLILRYSHDNSTIAVNCKIIMLKKFDKFKNNTTQTQFISYQPCSFMEYISKKTRF